MEPVQKIEEAICSLLRRPRSVSMDTMVHLQFIECPRRSCAHLRSYLFNRRKSSRKNCMSTIRRSRQMTRKKLFKMQREKWTCPEKLNRGLNKLIVSEVMKVAYLRSWANWHFVSYQTTVKTLMNSKSRSRYDSRADVALKHLTLRWSSSSINRKWRLISRINSH